MTEIRYSSTKAMDPRARRSWKRRWPNITPAEVACSHCGEVLADTRALDAWQAARKAFGEPVAIACWYRCPKHPLEAAKPNGPGAHSRGTAVDSYPLYYSPIAMREWLQHTINAFDCGFGFGLRDGKLHLHNDVDVVLGPRAWGY